ncbi:MAG: ABC transporter permease subunit, partial [Burkholderiales bacterium]
MDDKFPPALVWTGRIGVFAFFVALPFISQQDYFIHVVSLALIFSVAALGMQLLLGYAGLLSVGQAAFLGIGAYTSAMLTKEHAWPFLAA